MQICAAHGVKGPVVTEAREISHMNPGNVYLYSFDFSGSQTPESSHDMFPYEGPVNHTDELNYLFPLKKMNSDDVKMAKTMVQLWTSFASEGVPRAKDVPTWHPMGDFSGSSVEDSGTFIRIECIMLELKF